MENSCRKKYRMYSKNWVLASRRTGFRRNSALVPANAGLFHYAGNNPVRYIDPDGRDIIYQDNDGNEVKREPSEKNEIHTPASDFAMMEKNAKEMENNKWNLLLFARNVKTGGKWDFKDPNNPKHRSHYWFGNELVTAEEFGNIHYGYVGAAGGFGLQLLKDAPGIVQVERNTARLSYFLTNFDDPRDTANIIKGYEAYNMPLFTSLIDYYADNLYTNSGAQLVFRYVTFKYFFTNEISNAIDELLGKKK